MSNPPGAVNTVVEIPSGNSVTAWDQAAAANGLYEIREPVGTSDVSANPRNKNPLAWAQPDEPDGINSQVPPGTIQHNYGAWTSLDPNHPVYINFVGSLNQYDLQTGASGIAWYQQFAAGANWISADRYPVNNGESRRDRHRGRHPAPDRRQQACVRIHRNRGLRRR